MKKPILSFFLFGAILSATPVNVTLLNAGNPLAVNPTGQFYVGPYTLTLNGIATPAMCVDDFIDNNIGDKWQANVTSVTSSDFGKTYLGNNGETIEGYHATSSQLYTAEAYLFSLITKPGADRADIQEAAWAIMDPKTLSQVFNSEETKVQNYLQAAYDNSPSFDASGYSIISDVTKNGKQEFIVASAPEPASFALFGGGLLAAGAARFLRRRKEVKG